MHSSPYPEDKSAHTGRLRRILVLLTDNGHGFLVLRNVGEAFLRPRTKTEFGGLRCGLQTMPYPKTTKIHGGQLAVGVTECLL